MAGDITQHVVRASGGAPARSDGEAVRAHRSSERLPELTTEEALDGLRTSPGECAEDVCRAPGAPCASQPIVGVVVEFAQQLPRNTTRAKTPLLPAAPTAEAAAVRAAAAALGCNAESCVISHPSIKSLAAKRGISPKTISAELSTRFKDTGPRNTTALLSNYDIDGVLRRWAREYPGFCHVPFAMMDLDEWELGRIDLGNVVVRRGAECVGCIVNTDTSRGPGKHWVSVFVDARKPEWTVEYFNSAGNPPPRPMVAWMEKARARLADARAQSTDARANAHAVATVAVTDVDHQESQTECGIYALYYIRRRLEGTPIEFFREQIVPDAAMTAFRAHLFR